MKSKIIALIVPIFVGITAAYVSLTYLKDGLCLLRLEFVLNAIITCAVTFSGFILTSVSILIGLSSSPLMKHIRGTGGLSELRFRYTESLILGVVLIAFCIMLGANADAVNQISSQWLAYGAGLLSAYIISMIITGFYLLGVIGLLPSDKEIETKNIPSVPNGSFRV